MIDFDMPNIQESLKGKVCVSGTIWLKIAAASPSVLLPHPKPRPQARTYGKHNCSSFHSLQKKTYLSENILNACNKIKIIKNISRHFSELKMSNSTDELETNAWNKRIYPSKTFPSFKFVFFKKSLEIGLINVFFCYLIMRILDKVTSIQCVSFHLLVLMNTFHAEFTL